MPRRIVITGMGIISGIGLNLEQTLTSLLQSRSGIEKIVYLESHLKDLIPVSEVKCDNNRLMSLSGMAKQEGISRNCLLGIIAANEAYKNAAIDGHSGLRIGLISATTVGGMDKCELYYNDFLTNNERNLYIDSYDCADSTERIADCLGIKDYITIGN